MPKVFEDLEEQILLNTFALDRLDNYQDPAPKGDGFFDYIPGIAFIEILNLDVSFSLR